MEVVKEAAGNKGSGGEVMALLLERRGAAVQITEEVAIAAAGNWGSASSACGSTWARKRAARKVLGETCWGFSDHFDTTVKILIRFRFETSATLKEQLQNGNLDLY